MLADLNQQKGEFVLLVRGAVIDVNVDEIDSRSAHVLSLLASELPPKKAAAIAAEITGVHKKLLYQHLLLRE